MKDFYGTELPTYWHDSANGGLSSNGAESTISTISVRNVTYLVDAQVALRTPSTDLKGGVVYLRIEGPNHDIKCDCSIGQSTNGYTARICGTLYVKETGDIKLKASIGGINANPQIQSELRINKIN